MNRPSSDSWFLSPRDRWAVLLIFAAIVMLRAIREVGNHKMTTWIFDYEYGFIRRGFAGELISLIFGVGGPALLTSLSLLVLVLLVWALSYTFVLPWTAGDGRIGAWLFALVAVTHSGTLQHFAYDLGRLDEIGILLMLACLVIINEAKPTERLIGVSILCVVGLLIHEAYFILFVPLVLAAWVHSQRRVTGSFVVLSAILIVGLTVIMAAGSLTDPPFDQYVAQLQQKHGFPISRWASSMVYRDTRQNITQTMTWIFKREILVQHILLVTTLIPTIILQARVCAKYLARNQANRWVNILLITSALMPLAMYVVALDVFRWVSVALTNLFIVMAYLVIRDGSDSFADVVERSPVVILSIIAVSLVFGPIGIDDRAYPLFDGFWFLPNAIWP